MSTACRCGATWTGKRIEHCTACHQTFTGTTSGDRHRRGGPDGTRYCLSNEQMLEAGLAQNERGHWTNGGTSPWSTA